MVILIEQPAKHRELMIIADVAAVEPFDRSKWTLLMEKFAAKTEKMADDDEEIVTLPMPFTETVVARMLICPERA